MIEPPSLFVPLHHAPSNLADGDVATFVFRGNALLLGEADARLADLRACAELGLVETSMQALGMFGGRYCRTAWVGADHAGTGRIPFRCDCAP